MKLIFSKIAASAHSGENAISGIAKSLKEIFREAFGLPKAAVASVAMPEAVPVAAPPDAAPPPPSIPVSVSLVSEPSGIFPQKEPAPASAPVSREAPDVFKEESTDPRIFAHEMPAPDSPRIMNVTKEGKLVTHVIESVPSSPRPPHKPSSAP